MRQRSKLPGNGGSHPPGRANQPEHQGKLVLLFFILVIGCYMVIIQQRLFLPVHTDGRSAAQSHRKHMRVENRDLREEFQAHGGSSSLGSSPVLSPLVTLDMAAVDLAAVSAGGAGSTATDSPSDTGGDQQDTADKALDTHATRDQGTLQISTGSKDGIESSPLPDRLSVGVKSPSPAGADIPAAAAQGRGQAGPGVAARPAGSDAAGGPALEEMQAGLGAARQAAADAAGLGAARQAAADAAGLGPARQAAADAAGLAAGAAKAVRVGLAEAAVRALGTDQELPRPRSHQGQVKEKEVDKPVKTMRVHPEGPPVQPEPPEVWAQRREQVKEAMTHSWAAYEQFAWGFDELQPLTQEGKDSLGGLGATIVDSLDTLWMFDMQDEFGRARAWVAKDLEFDSARRINLFETTIRVVGGLLSAFQLSEDPVFLARAEELVQKMLPAFEPPDTSGSRQGMWKAEAAEAGIPTNMFSIRPNAAQGKRRMYGGTMVALAEYGSFGVEFWALSNCTGNPVYAETAERIYRFIYKHLPNTGLVPVRLNRRRGTFSAMKSYTVGAMADSYYEYLLKMWLLKGQQDEMYRVMWVRAMDDTISRLVDHSVGGLTFVGSLQQNDVFMPHLEHLTCFLPGNIALGVAFGAVTGPKADLYMELAQNVTYTCWQMYDRMPSGLAPESVWFHPEADMQVGIHPNQLRPEIVESFFYLWRVTGDERYRDWGWQAFQAFEEHCRTEDSGYAGIEDVDVVPPTKDNTQQSFWLAETLKYLALLFSPEDELPLDQWVLNTEAHPIRPVAPLTYATGFPLRRQASEDAVA